MKKLTCLWGLCLVVFLHPLTIDAQPGLNTQQRSISIKKTSASIRVDGILNESGWKQAETTGMFTQNFPSDTSAASYQTQCQLCFDNNNLYISAICYQPDKYTVQTLKRDFLLNSSDIFAVNIDPFGDRLNAFYFAVNPFGVQIEGQISNGVTLSTDWDNKWTSAVKNYPDKWVVEIAIPFKSLRYKRNDLAINSWLVNFTRNNLTQNENSSWVPVKKNFKLTDVTFSGEMTWAQAPPKPGPGISLIPYTLAQHNKNYQYNQPSKQSFNAGVDAKVSVLSSLNLDLTINPDFAQVEVDKQVTDLSRFELFFPEKRQFFIENSDLFANFGASNQTPFFSRRIGLNRNSRTGENQVVPIVAGARLSGRLNKDWRIGIMDVQTAVLKSDSLPATNFLVAAVQRRVMKRSMVSAILINKDGFVTDQTKANYKAYNRVGGAEFYYLSADNKWQARVFANRSFQPKVTTGQYSAGIGFLYNTPKLLLTSSFYDIDKNYNAEVGYTPRVGIYTHYGQAFFYGYPKGKTARWLNRWYINPQYFVTYDKFVKRYSDWTGTLNGKLIFQNTAELTVSLLNWDYTYLFSAFDPTNKYEMGFNILPAGSSYRYFSNKVIFKSDVRKVFSYGLQARAGQYFNGKLTSLQATVAYRVQPYGIFSIDANYNRIRLPQAFNHADFWLIGPKAEISFTKNIFWTTFFQYNNQANNFNINSRFQWRYKPLSDLFLVYTDNYFAEDNMYYGAKAFQKKNRAVVLKLNYWFNL